MTTEHRERAKRRQPTTRVSAENARKRREREPMNLRVSAAVLFFASSAFSQMHETVNVRIVEVPVSVVDSSGNPIRGLTTANFEVYDGGKKQAITSFDQVDFGTKEVVNAISPLNP